MLNCTFNETNSEKYTITFIIVIYYILFYEKIVLCSLKVENVIHFFKFILSFFSFSVLRFNSFKWHWTHRYSGYRTGILKYPIVGFSSI